MRTFLVCLLLAAAAPARAGYPEAFGAMRLEDAQAALLDPLLSRPAAELAGSDILAALLAGNSLALELFRQAAGAPSDGYAFAPRPERLTTQTPLPQFKNHFILFRLLLLDARLNLAGGKRAEAERDLLAAAGFMGQLSAQRSARLLSALSLNLAVQKAFPVMAASLRGKKVSPGYQEALAASLARTHNAMDFLRGAMLEETEMFKGTLAESFAPANVEKERAKLPFLRRLTAKRLQDKEFFDQARTRVNGALDQRAQGFIKAFETNNAAYLDEFMAEQTAALKARAEAGGSIGFFEGLKAGLTRDEAVKNRMADQLVYNVCTMAVPQYHRLVPRYHAAYVMLGALRAALAVKAWQRAARGRLPAALQQVSPGFMPELPRDSFNKFAPLVYARAGRGFRIYSYGPDGADGGGLTALDYSAFFDDETKNAGDIIYGE